MSEKEIAVALTEQRNIGFRHVYNSAVVEGYCNQLMETLDAGTVIITWCQKWVSLITPGHLKDIPSYLYVINFTIFRSI